MITVKHEGITNTYYGLSTDTKPVGPNLNGSIFIEVDTSKIYIYNETASTWREL